MSLPVSAGVWAAAAAPGPVVPPESTQQAIGCPSLFLLVLVGALVPVVPTGALVSSAAVVAFHQAAPFSLGLVFVTASLAAFLGDGALYWLGGVGCGRGVGRGGWRRSGRGRRTLRWLRRGGGWPGTGLRCWCCPGWCRRVGFR